VRCSRERKIRELKATILEQGKEIIALQAKLKATTKQEADVTTKCFVCTEQLFCRYSAVYEHHICDDCAVDLRTGEYAEAFPQDSISGIPGHIEVISVNGVEYVNKKQLQDYMEEQNV